MQGHCDSRLNHETKMRVHSSFELSGTLRKYTNDIIAIAITNPSQSMKFRQINLLWYTSSRTNCLALYNSVHFTYLPQSEGLAVKNHLDRGQMLLCIKSTWAAFPFKNNSENHLSKCPSPPWTFHLYVWFHVFYGLMLNFKDSFKD